MKLWLLILSALVIGGCADSTHIPTSEKVIELNLSANVVSLGQIDKSKKEVKIYSLTLTNDEAETLTGPATVASPFVLLTQNCNSVKFIKWSKKRGLKKEDFYLSV